MKYLLIIDQNPDDSQDCDAEEILKSNNQDDAIKESVAILKTGKYNPLGPNNKITGTVCEYNTVNKDEILAVKEISVKFGKKPIKKVEINDI